MTVLGTINGITYHLEQGSITDGRGHLADCRPLVVELFEQVRELEATLRPFGNEYVFYATNLLNPKQGKPNPQATAWDYEVAARTLGLLPTNRELWEPDPISLTTKEPAPDSSGEVT